MSWQISGSYVESCNCDPICPCRRVNGVAGGRSTHGECLGVLSWLIDEGSAAGVDLAGQAVAMAIRYSDDEEGSPWSWLLYLDERAGEPTRSALEDIFRGRLHGSQHEHFPWVRKGNEPLAVRNAEIAVDVTRRRQFLRVRDLVSIRIRGRYDGDATVTCVIPGHDRTGEELVADELRVDDDLLAFSYRGTCGYASTFGYAGEE